MIKKGISLNTFLIGDEISLGEQTFKQVKSNAQQQLHQMQDLWWNAKANEISVAADSHDVKLFYNLLEEVYGPSSSQVSPVHSQDGTELLQDPKDILDRWQSHFDVLLNRPSVVDDNFIQSIPSRPVKVAMASNPTLNEVELAMAKLNNGKFPGMVGLNVKIFMCGSEMFM